MVIRGGIRSNGKALADYLLAKKDNDMVSVMDISGTSHAKDLKNSLLEMSLTSELTRTDKGLYHVQICPRPGEDRRMTREDWIRAAEILEAETGFSGQKRIMVLHSKKGRLHCHVCWERYCHDTGKMIPNKYSRYAQDRARKRMEHEFEHLRTPENNQERPALRDLLGQLWQAHPSGKEFVRALSRHGYTVCRAEDRRPFVLVNAAGRSFNIVREAQVKSKDMRQRLKGLVLPNDKRTIEAIRQQQRDRRNETSRERKIREIAEQINQASKAKSRGR